MLKYWIQENVILPIGDTMTGRQVRKYFRFLQQSQYWTREQIDELQNERLRALIEHAYYHVSYYHDVMVERGLTPADIQTKEDLVKLPIITKETMRNEGIERFIANNVSPKERIVLGSSGSTGQPFTYYVTKESYSINIAANLRGWYSFGWRLGDKYVKIAQSPRKGSIKKIQDIVLNSMYIAIEDISDEHIYSVLKQIEQYKPIVIRSYPDSLFIIAQYRLLHKGEFLYHPLAVTTTGNVLQPKMREVIETAFGCKIYDSYSCEGNSCVFECTTHKCYHVSEEYGITEVLDANDMPVKEGIGRLITTDLWNYAMPFIRYDVQDMVELYTNQCSCGSQHLAIKRILGRENEFMIAPSGKKYSSHHFTVFFNPTVTPQLDDSVEQFQFVQHPDKSVTINVVVNNRYNKNVEQFLRDYWAKEMSAKIDVRVVDRMPITNNNKRKFIIVEK